MCHVQMFVAIKSQVKEGFLLNRKINERTKQTQQNKRKPLKGKWCVNFSSCPSGDENDDEDDDYGYLKAHHTNLLICRRATGDSKHCAQ